MLIDDIPYLKIAQEEHDAFAHVLRQQGIKVLYLEDLLAESLTDEKVRRAFLDQLLDESSIKKTGSFASIIAELSPRIAN